MSRDRHPERPERPPAKRDPDRQPEPAPPREESGHEEDQARVEKHAQVKPVHGNPSLDPTEGPIWKVAKLAGYGDGGYDSMMGVDHYVMGRSNAMRELEAPSKTEGTAMQLDPFESILTDDAGFGDLRAGLRDEEKPNGDWCSSLRLGQGEGL